MKRILIANRGEIACRIIRTAHELGLETVALYTEADAGAPHVALAAQAIRIGRGPVGDSYLNTDRVLQAARDSGADAVHPGYGFLSENAAFAQAVQDAGLIWIGPPPQAIHAMGNKAEAKRLMIAAGVPCVPGYEGADQSDETLLAEGAQIGAPIMVKAAAGGGGRGMRLVEHLDDLGDALHAARKEAQAGFGSDELILERAVQAPRHVEVQVFADTHGTCLHLFERDCSVQRRHQKVLEEAPCPALDNDERVEMGAAAVKAAQAIGYVGAGTVEFLRLDDGSFYFLEMNTRLQVEHPVTEMVTGHDLVALQIAVARGEAIPFTQNDVALTGHAIEARLYAEDPAQDFLPAVGTLSRWSPAQGDGVRMDGGVIEGQRISPFYDPLLAKIIAHGPDRATALNRLRAALRDTIVFGVATNRDFLIALLETDAFREGAATTALIETEFPDGYGADEAPDDLDLAARVYVAAAQQQARERAPDVPGELLGWASSAMAQVRLPFAEGARLMPVDAAAPDLPHVLTEEALWLATEDRIMSVPLERFDQSETTGDPAVVTAPMAGAITEVSVSTGDRVEAGQSVATLEAMKMQHRLRAGRAGRVSEVLVEQGAQITKGTVVLRLDDDTA